MADIRHIPLTLTSGYASTWGAWEGVRELVQNWHDGLYEMVDCLPIISSSPLRVCFEKKSDPRLKDEFKAFIVNPADQSRVTLGVLIYDHLNSRLTLINKSTSLHKRILLMGYSAKTEKREVIGQFGEGLKVGALSLVRDGRPVTMETSSDRWRFDLVYNEEFGEKVLTVIVSDRNMSGGSDSNAGLSDDPFPVCPVTLDDTDTCTSVTNITSEEWKTFLPRFLFLQPPKDSVKTELGTLLLDDQLSGQLFVKGVWVSDLREEDLAAGVNFASLQLDRDRNAVPRPSEIDHLVSGIWIKAVSQRPMLVSKYYDLLLEDKYRDVRHAGQYMMGTDVPQLISEQFVIKYGKEAIPVANTVSMETLQEIRRELSSKVVLCNQTFLNILSHSGNHSSVEEILAGLHLQRRCRVAYSELSQEEQNVLRHATKLIQITDESFTLSAIDVVHSPEYETCVASGDQVVVPHWMLELDVVHRAMRLCQERANQCQCREAWICCAVLELRRDKVAKLSTKTSKAETLSLTSHYSRVSPLQPVVALLAMESCDRTMEGFCRDLIHFGPLLTEKNHSSVDPLVTELRDREKGYLKEITELEKALEKEKTENTMKLSKLEKKLESVEKEMMSREISLVDAEEKIRRHCEDKLQQAKDENNANWQLFQRQLKKLTADTVELRGELKFKDEQLGKVRKQMSSDAEVFRRKEENLVEELRHYVDKLRERTELLSQICRDGSSSGEQATQGKCRQLAGICDIVLQDLQTEKFLCAVCKARRKNTMFLPCGHYSYCSECATSLQTSGCCPLCKLRITGFQTVYE